ncbi:MAG: 5-bromo-4-chloroindolyl phosphate hydrolysis family protein [Oscillospiraceae bacterium]|nr:5-bromo-4-chloroindolyl phosphate hydrolysis family protein [Oscillospiraceae bacterium]
MSQSNRSKTAFVSPIYSIALTWIVFSVFFPITSLSRFVAAAIISAVVCSCVSARVKSRAEKRAEEPEEEKPKREKKEKEKKKAEPEKSYGPEVDAILAENKRAQQEMGRIYASVQNTDIKVKIRDIMEISDKIAQDAIADPSDVPQIKKFQSYYLPTTIKLLNAYDRMGAQGIEGENISGTMSRIEEMLDTAIAAYRKQLDSLFANQALDIETDIAVMNTMLKREGLT